MAYPDNTGYVLRFMYPDAAEDAWIFSQGDLIAWDESLGPKPTAEQVIAFMASEVYLDAIRAERKEDLNAQFVSEFHLAFDPATQALGALNQLDPVDQAVFNETCGGLAGALRAARDAVDAATTEAAIAAVAIIWPPETQA